MISLKEFYYHTKILNHEYSIDSGEVCHKYHKSIYFNNWVKDIE